MHNCNILKDLNDAQQKVVLHGEGPALVAAGPGSGKTTCLTRRVLYLIDKCQIPPNKILVLTFTKEAAQNMAERFREQCKLLLPNLTHTSENVHFGTFHSFSYQILTQISNYSNYQLITTLEKQKIVNQVLEKFSKESISKEEINQFIQCISTYKNTDKYPESYSFHEYSFEKLFETYEEYMHFQKRLDFDDMLYLCKKEFLESPMLLKEWQNKYSYIMIDEFQDINYLQYSLMELLCKTHKNIVVVGDDDQAIYSFRGAYPDIFKHFQNTYKNIKIYYMTTNYRSTKEIIQASKKLIDFNKIRLYKELMPNENSIENAGTIEVHETVNIKECMKYLVSMLMEEETNVDRAILFRTNIEMQILVLKLEKSNIPYVSNSKAKSIYEHFIIKDLLDYFAVANGCKERSVYIRLFQKLKIPLGREALSSRCVDLKDVQNFYKNGMYQDNEIYKNLLALENHLFHLSKLKPAIGIKYILYAMHYYDYLKNKSGENQDLLEEWRLLIEWFLLEIDDYADYESLVKDIISKSNNRKNYVSKEGKPEGVHLLTLHGAKGREFDEVHIINVNEGNIPQIHRGTSIDKEKIEEERRLFYVGITRAKKSLHLHYCSGTEQRPKFKSRFLEELSIRQKTTPNN